MLSEMLNIQNKFLDRLKKARIIIADERSREPGSLATLLEGVGCNNLLQTTDRDELFRLLREGYRHESREVELAILSSELETFDVFEVTRQLSQNDVSNTPILLMTNGSGWWDETQLELAYQTGAVDFLSRPFRIAEVVPRLNLALRYRLEKKSRLTREEKLVTELSERKVMESRLEYLLNHDELTSLPSRHRLEAALNIAISKCMSLHRCFSLLYVDIDNFRLINEQLGHEKGDKLLTILADLFKDAVPKHATIARIGSDEFGILLADTEDEQAIEIAESISWQTENLICGDSGKQMRIGINIGVVGMKPDSDIKTASEMLARGDQACDIAKKRSGKSVFLYHTKDPALQNLQKNRLYTTLVQKAISSDWFELFVQPIVNLYSNNTSHYEVLLRLKDDDGVFHSPADFIPVAENNSLIDQLDFWVVDTALTYMENLPLPHADTSFSINLSGDGLQNPAILELIKNKIAFHSINPARLMFELTETAAVKDEKAIRETIIKLRTLGCKFAIDDFGTGFSSFNYIKNYPVDYIKIDGMFIKNLVNEHSDQILVKSMVDIAHDLGKKVIAEYVEDEATMDLLRTYCVDYVQGYHLGKPETINTILD